MTKNLLVINVLAFLATWVFERSGIDLNALFGLGFLPPRLPLATMTSIYIFESKFFPFSSCSKFGINSLMAFTTSSLVKSAAKSVSSFLKKAFTSFIGRRVVSSTTPKALKRSMLIFSPGM